MSRGDNLTGCLGRAALAEGGTNATVNVGAFNYAIEGIAYSKAAAGSTAFTATEQQKASTVCAYLVQINASGTVSMKKGDEVPAGDFGDNAYAHVPYPDDGNCPIGDITIETNSTTTFTGGTTDLGAGGITDTYRNYALGLPGNPITSNS